MAALRRQQRYAVEPIEIPDDESTASSAGDTASISSAGGKRKYQEQDDAFADEPDDFYERFQQSKKRKRAKTGKSSEAKKSATEASENGKGRGKAKGLDNKEFLDGEELARELVPDHIRERRRVFEENKQSLREAGLKLPPDYTDVEFSDDERNPRGLERRPDFDNIEPCRPYKDIVLNTSAGRIPAPIAQYLRDYQVEGVRLLHHHFVYQTGCILGDDMGLGKTIQVIAFLTAAFGKTGDERDGKRLRKMSRYKTRWYPRILIICVGSLIENWKSEFSRWGWWKVEVYHGSSKDDVLKAARSGALEIMVTTYDTYRHDEKKINLVEWDAVIADECHKIKERRSQITIAMDNVNALCRIGLTGTAIQNKYEELWTLLNWTQPGYFGSLYEWDQRIAKPLTRGQSHDATLKELSRARKIAKQLVQNVLPGVFLRRMKSLIAHQLPKKSDRVVFCPLTDSQSQAYQNLLNSLETRLIRDSVEFCDCGALNSNGTRKKQGWCCGERMPDGRSWQALIFPTIIALQNISNHLTLLLPKDDAPKEKREAALDRLKSCVPYWKTLYQNRNSLELLADAGYCGKWLVLKKLLSFWHDNGDKVLIFSHSVRLLRILGHLFRSTTAYTVSYLDGELSYMDRQKEVDSFNTDPARFIFLISTKAGGVGLNITSANKVVVFDPHWNPSYDLQAQDRAYRIGQVRDVEVFRLVSAGTIEEIVYARQIYKQQQANIGYNASNERRYFKGVQQDPERKGEIFGLQNLFSFHADQVILRDIVNKTNIAEARAGVHLVDIDMSKAEEDEFSRIKKEDAGDDEDDGGMSQLAEIIKSENPEEFVRQKKEPKKDALQGILASAGVEYTHENSEVIGTSKVEAQLSRRAELAEDMDLDDPEGQSALFADIQVNEAFEDGPGFAYKYKPPQDVLRRQFCTMSREFGFASATEFAVAVQSWTQEQRRDVLDVFYKGRMKTLLGGFKKEDEDADEKDVELLLDEVVKGDIQEMQHNVVKKEETTCDDKIKTEEDDLVILERVAFKSYSKSKSKEAAAVVKQEGAHVTTKKSTSSIFIYDDEDDEL
ncbi:Switch 2 [Cytospora mali]|uniref:Switch 2 n=1 Tax=Cytospora mali TaxID=578113 RepID=A0A194V583_CYTMA|nr:Switch 2 [Valsa mali var. pyri (nom. inval.)]